MIWAARSCDCPPPSPTKTPGGPPARASTSIEPNQLRRANSMSESLESVRRTAPIMKIPTFSGSMVFTVKSEKDRVYSLPRAITRCDPPPSVVRLPDFSASGRQRAGRRLRDYDIAAWEQRQHVLQPGAVRAYSVNMSFSAAASCALIASTISTARSFDRTVSLLPNKPKGLNEHEARSSTPTSATTTGASLFIDSPSFRNATER